MELKTDLFLRQKVEGTSSFSERDANVIWHPFTQMFTQKDPICITHAEGVYLYSDDGKAYLDGISSWWVNLHGHAHPYISAKIAAQATRLEHVMFAGFTHTPAIDLAEKLTALTGMDKIFYSDNGSTAIETAIKIALQFWYNANPNTKRKKILSLKGAYHGETFGAMSVSGKNGFNQPFWDHLFPVASLEPPLLGQEEQFLNTLEAALAGGEIAAFLFEPLILGVGGMKIYSSIALNEALKKCQAHGVLTIADEVMTGFGRTGPLFVCETLSTKPDMICLSKGITGGFLPLGATLCKQAVFEAFLSPSYSKALLHGHSYCANPLACVAALASLDLLLADECRLKREAIASAHLAFCKKHQAHPKLIRCESIGTILVLEYYTSESSGYFNSLKERLNRYFISNHILLRPFGNTVHVIPPYCITEPELSSIHDCLASTLEEI